MTRGEQVLTYAMPGYIKNIERARPEWADDVREGLAHALAILQEFGRAADANRVYGDLSEAGRAKATERAARVAQQKLVDFEKQRLAGNRRLQAQINQQLSANAAPKRPTDPAERISYEMRLREIRDQLRQLDQLQRLNVYLTTTDAEVIDAIDTAPPALVKYERNLFPCSGPSWTRSERRRQCWSARERAIRSWRGSWRTCRAWSTSTAKC